MSVCMHVCVCIRVCVCGGVPPLSHLLTNLQAWSVSTTISSPNSLMANLVIRPTVHTTDWCRHLNE